VNAVLYKSTLNLLTMTHIYSHSLANQLGSYRTPTQKGMKGMSILSRFITWVWSKVNSSVKSGSFK